MGAGEYVSVSSQRDAEHADLAKERVELAEFPEAEMRELTEIYVRRGLSRSLATDVARQLHEHDPLGAHLRDELGLDPEAMAQPVQAAAVSTAAFSVGSSLPWLAALAGTGVAGIGVAALLGLSATGVVGARLGGAGWQRGAIRVMVLGVAAMLLTAAIGSLVGAVV